MCFANVPLLTEEAFHFVVINIYIEANVTQINQQLSLILLQYNESIIRGRKGVLKEAITHLK
ncbi:hypothetical protein [Staphylococcus lutrae]|uniref:Uncharacterized protein n=1 Tax=Staphylococcus lutrae TaxID=155085 RepID=A0AAC9RSQ1_9STAP|nr:hypothetical protein [Staphylococcus lutrae]ARJ50484.1 hypothetical protein B5P37_03740 [Staphylococcus lutrae]PNZ38212.1 hypothetical protein CD134_05005 [Staphylococcus lutrae]